MEKVPGGDLEESCVLDGVMLNKDITHPKMRRRIENPRILLLDSNLEYKKGESMTNLELTKEADFAAVLKQEEQFIEEICKKIISVRPDIVCTEKGISGAFVASEACLRLSWHAPHLCLCLGLRFFLLRVCVCVCVCVFVHSADLAQHYLLKAGISCLRRLRKTDNNRIARASGATICNRPEEVKESDVGVGCGLFEVQKIGDDYFSYFVKCKDPKAVTILLRGGSKGTSTE